jgi:hypothetical protein
VTLEAMLSGSAAVRREMEAFELSQIWTDDDRIAPLDLEQFRRMKRVFRTTGLPLHVILAPEGPDGVELARIGYTPTMSPADYLAFLAKGRAAFAARR